MAVLSTFLFTNNSDFAESNDGYGWVVGTGITVDTLTGNDNIVGTLTIPRHQRGGYLYEAGIWVESGGILKTNKGNDRIYGQNSSGGGYGIFNFGLITTGDGNDNVKGETNDIGQAGLYNIGTIDTGNGNDTVSGKGGFGLYNEGTINTGKGNDIVSGIEEINGTGGSWGIYSTGTINTGDGNDGITGSSRQGPWGIYNYYGTIETGAGDDNISGNSYNISGVISVYGIQNNGMINTGTGNDRITGNISGGGNGILNYYGTIETGDGNDNITGLNSGVGNGIYNYYGTIETGTGDDNITGQGGIDGVGIVNFALIDTGDGNDKIRGNGIINTGTINTRGGDDIVDTIASGFWRNGTIDLGTDNDTLKGFGSGTFIGGDGTDKILFGDGIYTIDSVLGAITESGRLGVSMNVSSFEQIGGVSGGLFTFANGTLTVTNGIGTFV